MNTLNQSEGAWMGSIFKEVQNLDFGLSILDFSQGTVRLLWTCFINVIFKRVSETTDSKSDKSYFALT